MVNITSSDDESRLLAEEETELDKYQTPKHRKRFSRRNFLFLYNP